MDTNIYFNLIRSGTRPPIYNLTLLAAINRRRLHYLASEERKNVVDLTALKNNIDSIIKKLTTPSVSSTYNV